MNRILGGLFESVHLLGIAAVFGAAMLITWLTSPSLLPESFSVESAVATSGRVAPHLVSPARLVILAAGIAAVLAPYLRGDKAKAAAWGRVAAAALAALMLWVVWSDQKEWAEAASPDLLAASDVEADATAGEGQKKRSDRGVTPWNSLALATGLNLLIGAFQIYRRDD